MSGPGVHTADSLSDLDSIDGHAARDFRSQETLEYLQKEQPGFRCSNESRNACRRLASLDETDYLSSCVNNHWDKH